jgi:hypothetical protein
MRFEGTYDTYRLVQSSSVRDLIVQRRLGYFEGRHPRYPEGAAEGHRTQ